MWLTISQVNATLQAGLRSVGGIFSSRTTPSQASQELNKLSTNLWVFVDITTLSLKPNDIQTKNLPQGIAVGVSFSKATSAIKNLATPISPADANTILNNFKVVQTNTLAFIAFYKTQTSSYNKVMPGIYKFGLDTLRDLFNSLSDALATVDPSSISPETIKQLQSSVTSSAAL
ncbi:hypothetical protein Clacol_005880 [Clathrus columnatus]|uniref:Uncharacterized protein n=1 Tax=Clathrus columnatus TaxID=1419009 RepID=A0AAV5AEN5_9AGAM|nr:hypothetical protein Clacol_005880 [Clathrus columnatus]